MAKVIVTESYLENIGSAIRSKLGTQDTYSPSEMAGAISQIHGDPVLETLSATQNGTYNPSSGKDGFSQAVVNVPNSYAAGDEGKVVSNGALVAQSTQNITENGTYDTTLKNEVVVNVSGGGGGGDSNAYGIFIDGTESDPSDAVTYLGKAVGLTPAHMDYTNDVFDYGSWENAFFMPRPCMLKYDGTVDYYLDPDDYSKKLDGTASDISDTNYAGNAMMEWGRDGKRIWIKIIPAVDTKSASIYIADHQIDENYHDWSFHDCNGNSAEHFYTAIYNSCEVTSTFRSLSGKQIKNNIIMATALTEARANNLGNDILWDVECYADRMLINFLLILMGKSLDTQTVYGKGITYGGGQSQVSNYRTGAQNAKGLFYGTNSGSISSSSNTVKVFGMENWWGLVWRRPTGYIFSSAQHLIKLTHGQEDGTEVTDYNLTGSGYIKTCITGDIGSGYISEMRFTPAGIFSRALAGSKTSFYCDFCWHQSGTIIPLLGGRVRDNQSDEGYGGAFCNGSDASSSHTSWNTAYEIACKPLAV